MLINKLLADVEAKTGVTKFMQLVLVGSLLTNVLQAAGFLFLDKSVRTQLVPAEISRPFWVDGQRLSPEYLEQMGETVVMRYASVTPNSVDHNNQFILRYVSPSVHNELEIRLKATAGKIKQDAISRMFFPREIKISEQHQAVAFVGQVETWVADKKVPVAEIKAYLVAFQFANGAVTIKELRETTEKDPFSPPKQVDEPAKG